jgi:methionyl-tRNA synthetase
VLEFVQADAIARYQKSKGKEVALVTGADENSLKNVQAAEKEGITAQQLCDRNSDVFRQMADKVGLSYTCFRRTSDKELHWPGVQRIWKLCEKSGDVYKKKYSGLYCVGCEAFYEPEELQDGVCPEHKVAPERVEEENYFFRLSKYQGKLLELIESGKLEILPESRRNEVLSFVRGGLKDFSISRSVARAKGWGVPVPDDPKQIEYVWFDALGTYITGIGHGKDEKEFAKFWPADVHVIGKGILRFHAVYWPAMLLSAGLKLPKSIFVHGYITIEGQKMSKSIGNIIDPNLLIEKYGISTLRYSLLSESTFDDGDFSEKVLVERNNNELLANFGNLVNRTLVFASREFSGKVPEGKLNADDEKFLAGQNEKYAKIGKFLEDCQLKEALQLAMEAGKEANAYFQKNEPWKTAKSERVRCAAAIYALIHQVKDLAIALEPFMPDSSSAVFKQLNLEPKRWGDLGKLSIPAGHALGKPEILFRKIETGENGGVPATAAGKQQKKAQDAVKGIAQPAKPAQLDASSIDLEVGKIISVEKHPSAEKLYVEQVQMGDSVRQVVSGLVPYVSEGELLGKNVLIVKNLKPAVLRGKESQGMLLAAEKDGKLEVVSVPWAKPGDKAEFAGVKAEPLREITIEQFFSVPFEAKEWIVYAGGRELSVDGKAVKTEKVKDGKVK